MIDQRIEDKLRSLGLTACYEGYFCLIHSALIVEHDPTPTELISKWLYPEVGKRCGLTSASVSSAIRTAIHVCCQRNGSDVAAMCGVEHHPSAVQFIQGLARSLDPVPAQDGIFR